MCIMDAETQPTESNSKRKLFIKWKEMNNCVFILLSNVISTYRNDPLHWSDEVKRSNRTY